MTVINAAATGSLIVRGSRRAAVAGLLAFSMWTGVLGQGQTSPDDGVKYARGQNVAPVFEGWLTNPDGTFSLVFGYFNRNWEEDVFIPVGPDNRFEPGEPDRGQPTVFAPRRGNNLFEIIVPRDFAGKELVWMLTAHGKTEKAFASLRPQDVITREMISAGTILAEAATAGNDDVGDAKDANKPPVVTVAAVPPLRMSANPTATLSASYKDDGVLPPPTVGGRARTPSVAWSLYRGPAKVTFTPASGPVTSPTSGTATTAVTFHSPGTYWLRATATDAGRLASSTNVTVTVSRD